MVNLIKNELFKLNHRIETKVLIIFAILVTIVVNFMNYYFNEGNEKIYQKELEAEIEFCEDMKNNAETLEDKIYYYTNYDIAKLKQNYPMYSAETGYIDGTLTDLLNEMYSAEFNHGIDPDVYLEAKKNYEEALSKLENYDWKQEIKDEINANQEMIEIFEDSPIISDSARDEINYYQEVNRVLNYRLDNNIPRDGSNASDLLDEYIDNIGLYKNVWKDNKATDQDSKLAKMEIEKSILTTRYKLENELIKEDKINNGYTTIVDELISIASGSGFMIMFVAIFIASMIIPAEFEKGTIKQLLVKPYTRTEILISKLIATILYFIGFMIFFMIVNFVVVGIFAGFETIKAPIIVYNFEHHSLYTVSLIPYLLKCFLLVLPRFLLTIFIVNFFAILTKSTVLSMFIGLSMNMSDFTMLQKPIARFILSNCWDFNVFANGGISANKYVELSSSIVVVIVVAVIVLLLSNFIFKRKEIKNQ